MNISDFDYVLPPELIAQEPLVNRGASSLLVTGDESDQYVVLRCDDLDSLLEPGDLVIANDTRVIPARLHAVKPTGGLVEIMLERVLDQTTMLAQLRSNKPLKIGQVLIVGTFDLVVASRQDRFYVLRLPENCDPEMLFADHGSIPLPPYIRREADEADSDRYQTVFSHKPGAVAAPTAGLHFDETLIERLQSKGVGWATLTLHVGAGTFLPVATEQLEDHVMHAERVTVTEALCEKVMQTKESGGKIVAIGTTVVRALESAAADGVLKPLDDETRLFITPGFRFNVVDRLVTNFHLPKSTLLVLVSAFAGSNRIADMYQYAIRNRLRFFSYGDAMLLDRFDAV